MSDTSRGRRLLLKYGVTVAIVGLSAVVLSRLVEGSDVLSNVTNVRALPYLGAVAAFYATFPLRAKRWQLLLAGVGVRADLRSANVLILVNWFLNTVVPAKGGDLHRGYLAAENYGTRTSTALGTIATERAVDLLVLVTGLSITIVVVLPEITPLGRRLLRWAVGLGAVIGLGLLVLYHTHRLPIPLPARIDGMVESFRAGLLSFPSVGDAGRVLGLTVVLWSFNVVRMSLVGRAIGLDIGLPLLVLLALVVAFLSGLPYTPAGVGVVEVAITSLLIEAGVSGGVGFSFILFDRLITVGSLIVVGAAVYLSLTFRGDLTTLGDP